MTIEGKVAETILQEPFKLSIGGKEFEISHPSTATLIEVSKLVSTLPKVKLDKSKYIYESLYIAKDCRVIGSILATLILGVHKHTNTPTERKTRLKRLISFQWKSRVTELGDFILEALTPKELDDLLVDILKRMEIDSFFSVITSLLEVNLLRPTR